MPERNRVQRRNPWELAATRQSLIDGTAGINLDLGPHTIRISNSPLFRRDDRGRLLQAVRLRVQSPPDASGALTATIRQGANLVDEQTIVPVPGGLSRWLFVPEVSQSKVVQITIAEAGQIPITTEFEVTPQRKWSVYLCHHSHLDIGYTDPQAEVLQHQLSYLDAALDLIRATDDWPEPARFRWNIEVIWPLQHWLAVRPAADRDELIARVKEGRIEINALPFSMHTEAYAIDELAAQLRFADELRERYGVEIVSAMQSDVPGATLGLVNLLTAAGVRNLAVAHNYAGRSIPYLLDGQDLTRPFYWQAADGKQVLVWYTDTLHGNAYMEGVLLGLGESYETTVANLPEYLQALAQRPYPYSEQVFGWSGIGSEVPLSKQPYPYDILHLRVQSTFADNAAPGLPVAEIVRMWNEQWAYPHLRLATNREFFVEAEERYGSQLATYQGDWTDWWADGIGSGARPLGLNRRAQTELGTAQTLHSLAGALTKDLASFPTAAVDHATEQMALFDEHTWGAGNPWTDGLDKFDSGAIQWERKAAFAYEAFEQTRALTAAATRKLGHAFGSNPAVIASITVFNPSSHQRTDLVRVFLPSSRVPDGTAFQIADGSGTPVPHVIEPESHPRHRPLGRYLCFVANNLPPLGYARFDLVAGDAPSVENGAPAATTLENAFYRLEYDVREGRVASILDQQSGRELVASGGPFGFNQYIYDRYTSAPHFNHLSSRIKAVDLALLGSRTTGGLGVVTERSSNAVWDRLTTRLVGTGVEWLETTITLPRDVPRIDITNRLQKIKTAEKESVYFAFPFDLADPVREVAITGGVTGPAEPHVPGSADHMRAIRHWVTLCEPSHQIAWATLEAPLVEFGTIALPYNPFPSTLQPEEEHAGTIYSWALNNIWDTNFPPSQGGEMTFRYAIASAAAGDSRALGIATAAGLTRPLIGIVGSPGPGRDLPPTGSFCEIADAPVELLAIAPSRREHDLTLFIQSSTPEAIEAEMSFPLLPVTAAWHGTFLERDLAPLSLTDGRIRVPIAPGEFKTISIDLRGQ